MYIRVLVHSYVKFVCLYATDTKALSTTHILFEVRGRFYVCPSLTSHKSLNVQHKSIIHVCNMPSVADGGRSKISVVEPGFEQITIRLYFLHQCYTKSEMADFFLFRPHFEYTTYSLFVCDAAVGNSRGSSG